MTGKNARRSARVQITDITSAAEHGDRLEMLRMLRRRVAAALDAPKLAARDLASLSRRIIEIEKEIEGLEGVSPGQGEDGVSVTDEAFDPAEL